VELNELHEGVDHSLTNDRGIEGSQSPVMEQTIPQIRETAERQRVATAMRMASLATAARHATGDLEEQFPLAARYIRDAGSGFESISNLLRDPNLDEVATLISNLGRKRPAAIVAAVVLFGLGLSWLLNSPGSAGSSQSTERSYGVH
jgi:hypothetical protein